LEGQQGDCEYEKESWGLNKEQWGLRKEDRVERKRCLQEGGVSVGIAGLAWAGKGIKEDLETTLGVHTLVLEGADIATDARIPELCRGRSVPWFQCAYSHTVGSSECCQ